MWLLTLSPSDNARQKVRHSIPVATQTMEEQKYSPSGRGPQLIAVYIFFQIITTITVALRTYVRAIMVKNFGFDDWSMLIGWAIFMVFASFAITGAYHGTGQHAELILPAWNLPIGLKVRRSLAVMSPLLTNGSGGGYANHYTSPVIWL